MRDARVVPLARTAHPDDVFLAEQLASLLAAADGPTRFAVGSFLAATRSPGVTGELRLETLAGKLRGSFTSP